MQRRRFLIKAGRSFPVIAGAVYLIRCGKSSTSPSAVAAIVSTSTVVNGHTHQVTVPDSDQMHPQDTTYTSTTAQAHQHMVTLTASQLSTLAAGGAVTVTSTQNDGHRHDFTFQGKK